MRRNALFALPFVLTLLLVIGCSRDTTVDSLSGNSSEEIVTIAKTGAIKVDDDPSCEDDIEDNSIPAGHELVIWFNLGDRPLLPAYCLRIYDSALEEVCENAVTLDGTACDGRFIRFLTPCDAPSDPGTYRVKLTTTACDSGNEKNVSGDSFTVPAPQG